LNFKPSLADTTAEAKTESSEQTGAVVHGTTIVSISINSVLLLLVVLLVSPASAQESPPSDAQHTADANWSRLDTAKVLLEERFNDGTWIRDRLNTLHEFRSQ